MSLSKAEGRIDKWRELTKTTAETPMGQLLRRYWWPICGVSRLEDEKVVPVRLLGEDLVLYLSPGRQPGLVSRRCPHRGADLVHGIPEENGLRCAYHGWMFDSRGLRTEAPFEDTMYPGFCERKKLAIPAYPTRTLGGMVWAYLGPLPAPELPDWEFFHWENGFRQIVTADIPCNWLQCQENSIDPVHFEWLHSNAVVRRADLYFPRHVRLAFEEFTHGFVYRRIREGSDETDPMWQTGRVCLWPNAVFTGNHIEYRVPVDDENTFSIAWHFSRVPHEREPYTQLQIPTWHGPIRDESGWIMSHINNQDFTMWASQGRTADRSLENLGASDAGIVLLRKRFLLDLRALQDGHDPKAVIRDPAENHRLRLPTVDREQLTQGCPLQQMLATPDMYARLRGFIFQAGQPQHVRDEFVDAMGIGDLDLPDKGPVDFLSRKA
jgi:5,5'-dehydrodivanillate O-demethylase